MRDVYWAEAFHRSGLLHTPLYVSAAFGCIIITRICLRCPRFYSLFVFALVPLYSWWERDNLSFVGVIWRKWGPRFITIEFWLLLLHQRSWQADGFRRSGVEREKNVFVLLNEAAFQILVGMKEKRRMRFIMFAPAGTKLILLFDALQRIGEISFTCAEQTIRTRKFNKNNREWQIQWCNICHQMG